MGIRKEKKAKNEKKINKKIERQGQKNASP